MMRYKLTLTALSLLALATLARPVGAQESDVLTKIDRNLVTAATYLDHIRDDGLATGQVIEKAADALVKLAGQRNELVAAGRDRKRLRSHYDERGYEQEALEKTLHRARHRLSSADKAKTLRVLRRRRAVLKTMDGRLTDAGLASAKAADALLAMTRGLVAWLAEILRDNEYDSVLVEDDGEDVAAGTPTRFKATNIAKAAALLRKTRTLLAGMDERMAEAAALRTQAYSRMTTATVQFVDTLGDIVQDSAA